MKSLPRCLGIRPSLQVRAACSPPMIERHTVSVTNPILPPSKCCVRCWQRPRLFRRSLGCLDERRDAPTTRNGTSGFPHRGGESSGPFKSTDVISQWLALLFLRGRALQSASNLAVYEGKNRLAKYFIQAYLMFLPVLPFPDFLVLRKQLPLAF